MHFGSFRLALMVKNTAIMKMDFDNIDFLKEGTAKQRQAYQSLKKYNILLKLERYDPILVGTIPINIDIENSDLDIICYCDDYNEFEQLVNCEFGSYNNFKVCSFDKQSHKSIIARFQIDYFDIEIYCQDIPSKQQHAYRHMIIEYELLKLYGESFRLKIIELKRKGLKTEPAFGFLLGLTGNPYIELLQYESKL